MSAHRRAGHVCLRILRAVWNWLGTRPASASWIVFSLFYYTAAPTCPTPAPVAAADEPAPSRESGT